MLVLSIVRLMSSTARHKQTPRKSDAALAGRSAGELLIPHADIAALAYAYWQKRGARPGTAEDDWFAAEAELRRRAQDPSAA